MKLRGFILSLEKGSSPAYPPTREESHPSPPDILSILPNVQGNLISLGQRGPATVFPELITAGFLVEANLWKLDSVSCECTPERRCSIFLA